MARRRRFKIEMPKADPRGPKPRLRMATIIALRSKGLTIEQVAAIGGCKRRNIQKRLCLYRKKNGMPVSKHAFKYLREAQKEDAPHE